MSSAVKARPAVFRALGHQEPPATVEVDGQLFALKEVFKHDSWAATAMYAGENGEIVCKFNRKQSVYGLPMFWLGRFLADRENFAYQNLMKFPGIIQGCGPVLVEGKVWKNAVAHQFMPGHPLGQAEQVDDQFFPRLLKTLQNVHDAGFAYVDLHKRENVLVGTDGTPYLIDFQISFYAGPQAWLGWFLRPTLKLLQQSDLYHLTKHVKRLRPDQVENLGLIASSQLPWWIKAHRKVAVPFRETRRKFLSLIGVRGKSGRSSTEVFAEHAFRCEMEQPSKSSEAEKRAA